MSYNIYPTPDFKKLFKKLSKKHPSIKAFLQNLIKTLKDTLQSGIHLGNGVYKIRMNITSKGKGKSGGGRVITFLVTVDKEIYLTYIYDKSQLENISKEQINELLKKANLI